MQLVKVATGGNDLHRAGIVVQLPAGAASAATRRPGEAPDLAVVVELVKAVAIGRDVDSGDVVIEHLPARTRCVAVGVDGTRAPSRFPDLSVIVQLIEIAA
jgi:hypothetical protein